MITRSLHDPTTARGARPNLKMTHQTNG